MHKNIEDRRRCQALSRRRRVALIRKNILDLLGGKCVKCNFNDERALAIDHIDAGGCAERALFGGSYYKKVHDKIVSGAKEYQLLCYNCNQIKKHENKEERRRVHK